MLQPSLSEEDQEELFRFFSTAMAERKPFAVTARYRRANGAVDRARWQQRDLPSERGNNQLAGDRNRRPQCRARGFLAFRQRPG